MANFTQIQQLLETELAAIAGLPELTKEGVRKADVNTTWLRSTLIPATPVNISLGFSGKTEWKGILQVDIFSPEGYGTLALNETVDLILNHFVKGLKVSDLLIWRSYKLTNREVQSKFIQTPVIIEWSYFE